MKRKIKRIYHPYNKWECYQHGLYEEKSDKDREGRIYMAMMLLQQPRKLEKYMSRVASEWKHSCELHFSYHGYNRRAWLGQAACCLAHGATEAETKEAWNFLDPSEMDRANKVADKVIEKWERRFYGEEIS